MFSAWLLLCMKNLSCLFIPVPPHPETQLSISAAETCSMTLWLCLGLYHAVTTIPQRQSNSAETEMFVLNLESRKSNIKVLPPAFSWVLSVFLASSSHGRRQMCKTHDTPLSVKAFQGTWSHPEGRSPHTLIVFA